MNSWRIVRQSGTSSFNYLKAISLGLYRRIVFGTMMGEGFAVFRILG